MNNQKAKLSDIWLDVVGVIQNINKKPTADGRPSRRSEVPHLGRILGYIRKNILVDGEDITTGEMLKLLKYDKLTARELHKCEYGSKKIPDDYVEAVITTLDLSEKSQGEKKDIFDIITKPAAREALIPVAKRDDEVIPLPKKMPTLFGKIFKSLRRSTESDIAGTVISRVDITEQLFGERNHNYLVRFEENGVAYSKMTPDKIFKAAKIFDLKTKNKIRKGKISLSIRFFVSAASDLAKTQKNFDQEKFIERAVSEGYLQENDLGEMKSSNLVERGGANIRHTQKSPKTMKDLLEKRGSSGVGRG